MQSDLNVASISFASIGVAASFVISSACAEESTGASIATVVVHKIVGRKTKR